MPFKDCNGLRLYYEINGQGPALLLISGLSSGTWSWYGQVPFFKTSFRTITFDNRGAGQSDMPPGPYDMKELARDALCLLDGLGIEKAFVLALSMGGMIAQELALLAPSRIRALVLGCTHCGGALRLPPSPEVLQTLLANQNLSHEEIVEKNLPLFLSRACFKKRPDLVQAYRRAQLSSPLQPEHAFKAQLAAINSFDSCERLFELKAPTLIVTGSEDQLVPSENARTLSKRIPRAELVTIEGAGHALHAECPDRLNGLALDFFTRYKED